MSRIRQTLPRNNYNPPSINQVINQINQSVDVKVSIQDDITGTTRTLSVADNNQYLRFTSASAITVTVPAYHATNYPWEDGHIITLRQVGAGQITLSPAGGVTLNGEVKSAEQHKELQLTYTKTLNVWDVRGGIA